MHYRHRFHAGNFADLFKHALLCGLLAALSRKDKPWCYLETHAGAGRYDLGGADATRTGEWRDGIGALWEAPAGTAWPEPLATCLSQVRALNPDGRLRHYPGSPLFARALARPGDRLVLCERVPEVASQLRECLGRDRRVVLHQRDGYEAAALLPPPERRGLVLVDPPFEQPDEFDAAAEFVREAHARFSGGVIALWYPLKNRHAAARCLRRLARTDAPGLSVEFETGARGEGQMRACGLAVLNPPFGFAESVAPALQVLVKELALGPTAGYRVEALSK